MTSLTSLFSPPPNKNGKNMFGTNLIICGMTADKSVLNVAMESFTGEVAKAHLQTGRMIGLLMLDASQSLFAPEDIPGLMHVSPPRASVWNKRTALMHAKVALLGFSDSALGTCSLFRLIISTGNWTRDSFGIGGEIDMVWSIDTRLHRQEESYMDCCAAFNFLHSLLTKLYEFCFDSLPDFSGDWINTWKKMLPKPQGQNRSRFIHSLYLPLMPQIEKHFNDSKYGSVICGSGFFEQPKKVEEPVVFRELNRSIAKGKKQLYVVININRAGALAGWFKSGNNRIWDPHIPIDPERNRTSLHAKFIAALQGSKNKIVKLYIGSGNLSVKGLLSTAAKSAGNVEAGVVFSPIVQPPNVFKALACGNRLENSDREKMAVGISEPLHQARDGSPIRWFTQIALKLIPCWCPEETIAEYQDKDIWLKVSSGAFITLFSDSQPTSIKVRRSSLSQEYLVPVFNSDGSYCRLKPTKLSPEGILSSLIDFPNAYISDEDLDNNEDEDKDDITTEKLKRGLRNKPTVKYSLRYPVKWVAELIESIARQHDQLKPEQYRIWFSHLRLVLCEQVNLDNRSAVLALRINPFMPLLREEFRPAELSGELLSEYENLIRDIQQSWQVDQY